MGFWERLVGPSLTQSKDVRRLQAELAANYREEARLARQIRAHADRSPHQAGAQALRRVAEEQDRLVHTLQQHLIEFGGEASNADGPVKEGKNHWARVIHDLEDSQTLSRRYNERGIYWDPDRPDAVTLFRTLEREKHRINSMLREIVVRADPHAID